MSTFDALFSGKKHLFDGSNGTTCLAAAEYFARDGYRSYPVVHSLVFLEKTGFRIFGFLLAAPAF